MEIREQFIKAVEAAENIPVIVRANAAEVGELYDGQIDQPYLDFLERQPSPNPKGANWEALIRQRRIHLLPFLGAHYALGFIPGEDRRYIVMVNLATQTVMHWE